MKLKRLTLQGFRSFIEPQTIVFPDNGLFLLKGDSGAGKTSILLAIAFALDVTPKEYSQTELGSWDGTPLQVELELEKNGVQIIIGRGKKTFITIGEETATGSKAYQAGLLKIFGISPQLYSLLIYRAQDTAGSFLSMSDADKKEYLSALLALDQVESVAEQAAAKAKTLELQITEIKGRLSGLTAPNPPEQKIEKLEAAILQLNQELAAKAEVLQTAQVHSSDIERQLTNLHNQWLLSKSKEAEVLKAKFDKAQVMIKSLKDSVKEQNKDLLQKQKKLSEGIHEAQLSINKRESFRVEKNNLEKSLAKLKTGTCNVCHQPWSNEKAVTDTENRLKELDGFILTHQNSDIDLKHFKKELSEILLVHDDRIDQLEEASKALYQKIANLNSAHITDANIIQMQKVLSDARHSVAELLIPVGTIRTNIQRIQDERKLVERLYATWQAQMVTYNQKIAQYEAEIKTLTDSWNAELDFAAALGRTGFMGVIFDEILAEIAEEANKRLRSLVNTEHLTISFESEWEAKNGKSKRSIVPVILAHGHRLSYRAGLSGGQRTSVDQAVDLATKIVVSRRTGCQPAFLMLDEVFNGQPPATKEAALEILQQFAQNSLVIVIDHSNDFQQLFNNILEVKINNGVSYTC
jgi:DNA repair exonuclease SbcCD ATPase subunit